MNTTAAATQANVTVATVRTWCRRGVVTAAKVAGRWVIDNVSLAARIAIGAMKRPARQETAPVLDLAAVTIKTRTKPTGETLTKVTGYSALLADKLAHHADAGDRIHAANVLDQTVIILSDTPDADWDGEPGARHAGTVRTSYRGGAAGVTVDDVLDLAEQLRAQLAA
ncbi:helix-turn-helix domain-containing protein [Streptomyces sp. M2CJ-2]|uniref:helix-turn-helix domain-containing protein n=1 Tax=Streptomyces sp. M2CJ-2 TaxID=2803948 RepID=UPI001921F53A|nr:helix-turn-helix domain-containing protein [Streptomyces sp. M2CJ-2]MBL3664477.1 helix-turn-helix domain-containing protein [Streptomyces sp. M2CJ-2]